MKGLVIIFLVLMQLSSSVLAENRTAAEPPANNIASSIPYSAGKKNVKLINSELALGKHPMLSSALLAVVENSKRCKLYEFDYIKRSENAIRSTQFNGGEIHLHFIYFCYNHNRMKNNDGSDVMADVVLDIEGDFSEGKKEIYDPKISYSRCYSHFCGSN